MTPTHRHSLPSEDRLAGVITAITRRYLRLRREGRPVAHLLQRSRQISACYLQALHASRSAADALSAH
ncbi:MAG: hypothetical protein WCJ14_14520 [Verrucomicrobiota bacterium]